LSALPHRAFPVVLAAPSGAGKTSIARKLVESSPELVFSVSVTTRARRPGERDNVDYRFVDPGAFDEMVRKDELCEWAEVHGNRYGTPRAALEDAVSRGEHVVLDIDVQGARQLRASVPDALLIFVLPPSAEVLVDRLTGRATEAPAEVERRLRNARAELAAAAEFDYVVVNDQLDAAVQQVREIVRAEAHRTSRARDLGGVVERACDMIDRILEARFEDVSRRGAS
jgi:guanylate kinase